MPIQRSQEPLCPYPRSQASSALRVENDRLKTEVEELQALLAQSRGQVSTLTSLLRDTSSSLDLQNQELEASCWLLEEVVEDHAEYQQVLPQFQAIEAELPEPPSEAEVGFCKEVSRSQKQEIVELRKQIADATNRLEELEEMVCRYWDRAHVAEGLIRQYPKDE
ncbi:MAG: hypothetical protein NXY57DRAFT_1044461, partial [Lentinula lateritia]